MFSDRRLTIETLLEIEDKERQLVPFKLNSIQSDMLNTSTWRDIYIKPGQVGATSYHVADFYIDNITVNGTVSVIVSYDEFSAQRLILKAKKYHYALARKIPSVPKLDHKSSTELSWEVRDAHGGVKFYSVMYIFSARSYVLGRGETIHNLLLDEYGFWPLGTHEVIFASAVQRVPLKPGTKVRVQSTANGEDNPFCEMYRAAREGTNVNLSVYKHHFYPWFIHEEYVMWPDDPFCLRGDDVDILTNLSSEEQSLLIKFIEEYGFDKAISMAKLRWRRYKKAEMASLYRTGETMFIFGQEFPEDDVSCFLVAGDQAYDVDIVADRIRNCIPAMLHRNIIPEGYSVGADLEVWHDVEEGLSYLVSIDPGKGKVSESVAHVWRFLPEFRDKDGKEHPPIMQHCATLAGFYESDEMADYCKVVAHYYNDAVICPESNLDIIGHLKDYPSLYYREDVRTGSYSRAIGWETNLSTKPYMITEVNRHLEHIDCRDIRFWTQCGNIRRNKMVKGGIVVVGADDHHDAGAIAVVCRAVQAVNMGYVGNSGDAGGWDDNWG